MAISRRREGLKSAGALLPGAANIMSVSGILFGIKLRKRDVQRAAAYNTWFIM